MARIRRTDADAHRKFGPHTAEVEAFIPAVADLSPYAWQQVFGVRRLVSAVTKEGTGEQPAESARSIQEAIRGRETHISEPLARAGEALFEALAKASQQKQVAAWQALSGLVLRSQLPPMKFAVNYAPFAGVVPVWGFDVLDPKTAGFLASLENLSLAQCEVLARRWRPDPLAARALSLAAARHRHAKGEEAAAIAALWVVPTYLSGDQGWAAVRTAAHGGRVLASLRNLAEDEFLQLWAPIEPAIRFAALEEIGSQRADVVSAIRPKGMVIKAAPKAPPPKPAAARRKPVGVYGPATADVAAFIKGLGDLTPIQWLRVLDRRKLVASVTREGTAEPASVVRSLLASIAGTRELDMPVRCRAFAAVERASHAVEAKSRLNQEQAQQMFSPFELVLPMEEAGSGGFARRLESLQSNEWEALVTKEPESNAEAVAPLVSAGTAMLEFFGGRSDDEVVAAWHAGAALVRRHHLTPIKFAASYAPFASAIPVTRPRSLSAMASRYVTAIGRLGATQCEALAQPWQIDEAISSLLSRASADGASRAAEEAAALAAVVTVPMRMMGGGGWAAVKTAAYGGRVIAMKARLTVQQLDAMWAPIQPAIPLASLDAAPRARR